MRPMMCIQCGSPTIPGSTYCRKCIGDKYDLFRVKSQKIVACSKCNVFRMPNGKWLGFQSEEDAIKHTVTEKLEAAGEIKDVKMKIRKSGNRYFVNVTCTGSIETPDITFNKTEAREAIVAVTRRKCDNCVKLSGNYYEAVLQLRGENADEMLKKIKKLLEDRKITKIESDKHGHDVFLLDKTDSKNVERLLKNSAEIKKSYKLSTVKKGKELYRTYVSIR
ncbi:MAG: NMD3-related protein [Candidatus Aenigmatarchaeota archaeon]